MKVLRLAAYPRRAFDPERPPSSGLELGDGAQR
jgi:hypothetical protein